MQHWLIGVTLFGIVFYAAMFGYLATGFKMNALICLRHGCTLEHHNGTYSVRKGSRTIRLAARHEPYVPDMARNFDLYFSQVEAIGNQVDYSEPRLHKLANGMEFEIPSFPEESECLDAYFREYLPNRSDLAFDIGAYCGIFTERLSRTCGTVIAFEPDPLNFPCLIRNIERHGLVNVIPVPSAITNADGVVRFNSESALGSGVASAIDRPSAGTVVDVTTFSLESACRKYGIPSFIKIDAEGSEVEIISGALEFIKANPIHFAIDTNHVRFGKPTTHERIEELFLSIGYAVESSEISGCMTTWATAPRFGPGPLPEPATTLIPHIGS